MSNILYLTKKKVLPSGLWDLDLDAFEGTKWLARFIVNSGAPHAQRFRSFPHQVKGQLEPIPEGEYDLGPLEWAGQPGDFSRLFPLIASPVWVAVVHSRAIGFHLDGNRQYAPGSAGCPVWPDQATMKAFVKLWDAQQGFSKLFVDWKLGHVDRPVGIVLPK